MEDDENVWLNQPDNLVGKSPILDVDGDDDEYNDEWWAGGSPCPISDIGLSDLVRGRGKGLLGVGCGTGSIMTGGSESIMEVSDTSAKE